MTHNLRFGSIDMSPEAQVGDVEYLVYGLRRGKPVPVTTVIESLIRDGAAEQVDRYDNRDQAIVIGLRSADSGLLAAAEADLFTESQKVRNELAFTPVDGIGATTVFDVLWADLEFVDDTDDWDLDELRNCRTYRLTVRALPFGRSDAPTTIGSSFVADSESIEDDCEDETGWSVYGGYAQTATITVDSTVGNFSTGTGAVKFEIEPQVYVDKPPYVQPDGVAIFYTSVRKTGLSIDASGGGYFMFRFRSDPGYELRTETADFFLTTTGGGRQAANLVSVTSLPDGFKRYALLVPDDSTITGFEIEDFLVTAGGFPYGSKPPNPSLWFDSLGLASGATENQAARTMTIGGSVRSEGSFEISAAVGLGDVVLFTCTDRDDGFRPDLRRFTSAGVPVSDAAAINGSYIPANTGEFEAPANIFRPGAYAVLARIKSSASSTPTLSINATTVLDGTDIGETYTVDSGTITVADTTNYHIVRIGVLDLPPHRVASAADAVIRFELDGVSTIHVDEVMVFPLEDAALTWVECGSGSPSASVASRVWIDGPSTSLPLGQILIGNEEDRTDARYVRPRSKGRHLLYPGQMLAYLLTSAAGGADMATTYFRHWHTWAAD